MKWIKATDQDPPVNLTKQYHVKKRWKGAGTDYFPSGCIFNGSWRTDDDLEILEWLDESPADGDWISVKDGLPEVEKSEYSIDVLTISDYGVKIGFCDIGRKEWWLTTDSDEMLHNVTHWMPLPAPPKQSLTAPEGV